MSEVFSGEDARRLRLEVGIGIEPFWCELLNGNPTTASEWERGLSSMKPELIEAAKAMLEDLLALKNRHREVALDMNNIRFVRKALKEMGRGKPPVKIDQGLGGAKVTAAWCAEVGLTPHELSLMEQLKRGVLERELISLPAQRWNCAWREAIDAILAGRTFAAYAADFDSRNEAITQLANAAFAGVTKTYSKEQVIHYMRGLLITGELKGSSLDTDIN